MDFSKVVDELKQASLFELFRLSAAIDVMIKDPARIQAVRRRLRVGMTISYFDDSSNQMIEAVVLEINRSRLSVRNLHDDRRWSILFGSVNLDRIPADIHAGSGGYGQKLDRNQLRVGEMVGFHHNGGDLCGTIVRLNPKTVTLMTTQGQKWFVHYGHLFRIMEGESHHASDPMLIEGVIIDRS
ncbi:MAG: hypothetical protein HQL58_09755 [Magnetococcales bacterium]|nr:hypothetical protein [Magnetococcales bacterium]